MFDPKTYFYEIETRLFFCHPFYFLQMIEKLSSSAIFHNEPDIVFGFERKLQLKQKRMIKSRHNVSFVLDNHLFSVLGDEVYVDQLQSVHFASIFLLH
jgi:hypothetical protein